MIDKALGIAHQQRKEIPEDIKEWFQNEIESRKLKDLGL